MGLFRKNQPKKNQPEKIVIKSTNHFSAKAEEETQQDDFFISEYLDNSILVVVADGIREKPMGEFASKQAIDVFRNFFIQIKNFDNPGTFLHRTILVAATMLMNKSMTMPEFKDASASLSGFVVQKNKFYAINTGNCRVYHFSENKLKQISIDQTVAQQLLKNGEISEEDLFNNQDSNKLTHYLSSSITNLRNEIYGPFDLKNNDILIASTGGLHFTLKNDEIEKLIIKNQNKSELADILSKFALNIGAKKNITVCSYIHQNTENE
ncbi:MAG: serine/threonine-protein phosphatase [Bacteroidales bacterium]|nr:serine/threonine-protein phosphatase [Bacteroidales bacterium]